MPTQIIAVNGNAAHLPANTMEACISAYTAGADGLLVTVQRTSDGALVLYDRPDLAEQTDLAGSIAEMAFAQVLSADAGATFGPGQDKPWRRNTRVYRSISLGLLDQLLLQLEDNVTYFVAPGVPAQSIYDRVELARATLEVFAALNRVPPVFVADSVELAEALRAGLGGGWELALLPRSPDFDPARVRAMAPSFTFGDAATLSALKAALAGTRTRYGLVGPADAADAIEGNTELLLTPDVTRVAAVLGLYVQRLTEDWPGTRIDRQRWVVGISSGHHMMLPMLGIAEYVEPVFSASTTTDNGLKVSVVQGRTYASAGAVSRFTIGEAFLVDVDFTYDNPQVANMMVLSVINQEVWPGYYHLEGVCQYPSPWNQNHAFDTHGSAPFVSMEREEKDGFRLMKYSSTPGIYEWYGNYYLGDVGNGTAKAGKLRLERRGRFFTGYYQDENNSDWIGVGSLENSSMNSRVYLRLCAKHYPKADQDSPDLYPLEVKYNHLVVCTPRGPVFEVGIASPIQALG